MTNSSLAHFRWPTGSAAQIYFFFPAFFFPPRVARLISYETGFICATTTNPIQNRTLLLPSLFLSSESEPPPIAPIPSTSPSL